MQLRITKPTALLLGITMIISFVLLGIFLLWSLVINNPHIKDTNGDDTSLVEVDLSEPISVNQSSYTATGKTERQTDNATTFSARKLSGTYVLYSTRTISTEALLLSFDITLESGNAEIYVVNRFGEIVFTVDMDGKSSIILPADNERYYVVIGAESAEISIRIGH